MMVRKMYLLPNMVVFGIYVRFQGGIAFSLPNTFVRIVFLGPSKYLLGKTCRGSKQSQTQGAWRILEDIGIPSGTASSNF